MRARYDMEYEHLADSRFFGTFSSDRRNPRLGFRLVPLLGADIFWVCILASVDALRAGVLYVAHQLGAPRGESSQGNFQITARYGDRAQCAVSNKRGELVR